MRLIPVLDVRAGVAVHAIAGTRAHYRPLASVLHEDSDPVGLARALRDQLGLKLLYLADLDAIAGGPPSAPLLNALSSLGLELWVDAGLRDASSLEALESAGVGRFVAGLETLRGPDALGEIIASAGSERVLFSLDLRAGQPIIAPGADWGTREPLALADIALALGVRSLLVLDLAHVGTGRGIGTRALLEALTHEHRGIELVAGGGISSLGEVQRLESLGVSAVLVGSALHDGRIGRRELNALG